MDDVVLRAIYALSVKIDELWERYSSFQSASKYNPRRILIKSVASCVDALWAPYLIFLRHERLLKQTANSFYFCS